MNKIDWYASIFSSVIISIISFFIGFHTKDDYIMGLATGIFACSLAWAIWTRKTVK